MRHLICSTLLLDHNKFELANYSIKNNVLFGKQFKEEGVSFHKEPANIGKIRGNFFLNRTIPLWNDLPVKVNDAKSLDSFKAELDGLGLFSTNA